MLLQFELDGQNAALPHTGPGGEYTFKLQHALSFSKLTLRTVSIQCGNDKLAQIWSYSTVGVTYDGTDGTRKLTAPLYLDMSSFLDSTHTAHYLPTGHPHGSNRTHVCSNGVVDISHAMPSAGSSLEQGKLRAFDYPLISGETHWPAGKQLTFALKHGRSSWRKAAKGRIIG